MNKRQITATLREASFSPGKLGPMKIIADVGNVDYYINRSREFLSLSRSALTLEQKRYYLNMALSTIALAKVTIDEGNK